MLLSHLEIGIWPTPGTHLTYPFIPITTPHPTLTEGLRLKDTDWTSLTELVFHPLSPSAANDWTGNLDTSLPKLERSVKLLNSELVYWLNSNWKPNSCLIPTLSLDDPLTQPWEILSEVTPSRAPDITTKPKLLPRTRDDDDDAPEIRRRRGDSVGSHSGTQRWADAEKGTEAVEATELAAEAASIEAVRGVTSEGAEKLQN